MEALPGEGWDYMVAGNEVTFVSGVPLGHDDPRRRVEQQAAANVGDQYEVRMVDS